MRTFHSRWMLPNHVTVASASSTPSPCTRDDAHIVGDAPACAVQGFRRQTAAWPAQPVDVAAAWLARLPAAAVVADFGAGDAALAGRARQRVHSFDLVAGAPGVVACNMAHTPLGGRRPNHALKKPLPFAVARGSAYEAVLDRVSPSKSATMPDAPMTCCAAVAAAASVPGPVDAQSRGGPSVTPVLRGAGCRGRRGRAQ
jgi:hypothetical protein